MQATSDSVGYHSNVLLAHVGRGLHCSKSSFSTTGLTRLKWRFTNRNTFLIVPINYVNIAFK